MEKGIMHGLDPGQIGTSTSRRVGKVLGKKSVSVFQRTCSEIQLTLKDSCVRVAVRGGGGEVQEVMKNKRDLQVLEVSDALWK